MTSGPGGDDRRRAELMIELGRHAEARDMLTIHLTSAPEDAQALCLLARCCLALGDRAALQAAEAAVRLDPDDPHTFCLAAFAASVQRQMRRARRYADAAVELAPNSLMTLYTRAQIEHFAIWPSRAGVAAARAAVRIAPDDADAHRVLGELLRSTGKATEGTPHLRTALRLDPSDPAAHSAFGTRLLDGERIGPAAERFATAAALSPTDTRAAHNLVVLAGRLVRNVHLVLILATLWVLDPDRSVTSVRIVAAVGLLAAAVAMRMMLTRVRRAMPGRGRAGRFFRGALRRDRLLAAWVTMIVVGLVCLVLLAVLPAEHTTPWRVVLVLAVGVIASVIRLLRYLGGRTVARPMV